MPGDASVIACAGERIGEAPWLSEVDDISVGRRITPSWKSGGVEYPHEIPPYPLLPSRASAHSSEPCHESSLLSALSENPECGRHRNTMQQPGMGDLDQQ